MIKRVKKSSFIYASALFQIFLMISLTFALAVFMNVNFVSGEVTLSPAIVGTKSGSGIGNLLGTSKTTNVVTDGLTFTKPVNLVGKEGASFVGEFSQVTKISPGSTSGTYNIITKDATYSNIDLTPEELTSWQAQATSQGAIVKPAEAKILGYGPTVTGGSAFLVQGLNYALLVAGVIQLIGSMAGLSPETNKALTLAAVGGIMAGKAIGSLGASGFGNGANLLGTGKFASWLTSGQGQFAVGALVAVAIFVLMYKDTTKKTINFLCLPYEAPLGGAKCEECNKDDFRSCSEYRCKSLGQACELLNPGTAEEKCAWVGRDDVKSPTITPWVDALKPQTEETKLVYTPDTAIRPPQIGTKIITTNKGCLPAFTPLEFGIINDEPSQCKIDYNHTTKFDQMQYYFGDNNYYLYNHTQKMRLPSINNDNASAPTILNNGNFNLFVRCRDRNGNENVDEYVFSFCVDKAADTTPPIIENFSIPSGSYVTYGRDSIPIEAYVNEPAVCKWSTESKSYDDMENTMSCATSVNQFNADMQYTCKGNVTGVKNMQENKFYFKCRDQPDKQESDRNTMVSSEELILKGSQALNIINIQPNETITGSTDVVDISLGVETDDGAENGKAVCYFSNNDNLNSYVEMFDTNNYLHNQTLRLPSGQYKYFVRCVDAGGNVATANTTFSVYVDKKAPMVTRLYREFEALKIVTDEDAVCAYSQKDCNFNFADGTQMQYSAADIKNNLYADWHPTQTYYIKCKDEFDNEPSPNMCSVIAMPIVFTNSTA